MKEYFDIWQFLAGLGVFLFGLYYVEDSLKNLAGRSFKKFLRTQTTNPVKGVLSGTVVTAILQSSSVVSLMVLAFVGAGILTLRNAVGIIFGTNLGTTFTGWIVASLGFEVRIESFALPLLGVGGIMLTFFSNREKLKELSRLLLGFGFLFIGLDFMKSAVDHLATNFDVTFFENLNPYWLFPIGIILTAIIQSSSAAMVIALSALNAGIFTIEAAAVFMVGSNLGTTVTVVLGAIQGNTPKKRVAASHVIFNLITGLFTLALVNPLLWVIINLFNFTNSLFILVAFHSTFNLLGILLLLPFIGIFTKRIESWFRESENRTKFISKVPTTVPEAAIEALKNEVIQLLVKVVTLNIKGLKLNVRVPDHDEKYTWFNGFNYREKYFELKELEGEIISYYLQIQTEKLEGDEAERATFYNLGMRNAVQSAKGIKDIEHNMREFTNSSNDDKVALINELQNRLSDFYRSVTDLFQKDRSALHFELFTDLSSQNQKCQEQFRTDTYNQAKARKLSEIEVSTLLNVNREIYSSNKLLIQAMTDIFLSNREADDFARLPERGI